MYLLFFVLSVWRLSWLSLEVTWHFWGGRWRAKELATVYICLWEHMWDCPPPSSFPPSSQFRGHGQNYQGVSLAFLHSSALTLIFPGMKPTALESLIHLNVESMNQPFPPVEGSVEPTTDAPTWSLPISPISSDLLSCSLLCLYLLPVKLIKKKLS